MSRGLLVIIMLAVGLLAGRFRVAARAGGDGVRVYDVHAVMQQAMQQTNDYEASLNITPQMRLDAYNTSNICFKAPMTLADFQSADAFDDTQWTMITMVQESVAPDRWRENGGLDAMIWSQGGCLVVDAPGSMHGSIQRLLSMLTTTQRGSRR